MRRLIADGLTVLLVEQDVSVALQMAHRGYVLENGKIALHGTGDDLRKNGAYTMKLLSGDMTCPRQQLLDCIA